MKTRYILYAIAIIGICACQQELSNEKSGNQDIDLVFTAGWGSESPTSKTALQENGSSIWWSPGDKINAFYGSLYSGKFYSSATQQQAFTSFSGTLTALTGTVENGNPASSYWAVYPYHVENSCNGESVTLRLATKQNGTEGTFDNGLFPAIATSQSLDLVFYNVAGGVRFTVNSEGINSVSFKSRSGSMLSGKVRVSFDENGYPAVREILEGADSVVVTAPVGGFVPGAYYFAAMLPGTHSQGLSLRLRKDGGYSGTKNINKSITVNRSVFGKLDNLDDGVTFMQNASENYITFKDKTLRAKLIAAFDTNGDHELSYDEAAAVTSFGTALRNIKTYKSFDEFQYFTGITEIPDYFFDGWASMTSISIPSSVKMFGAGAFRDCASLSGTITVPDGQTSLPSELFSGCKNLEYIDIPKSVKQFGNAVFKDCQKLSVPIEIPIEMTYLPVELFSGCSSLTSITIPESVTAIGSECFRGCSSLTSITIPESVTAIGGSCFKGCSNLTSITIPESVTTIGDSCFWDCSSLTSITIPESVTTIGVCCFQGCSSLTSITIPESVTSIGDYCFQDCTSLTSITIPESVTAIGSQCFRGCSSLTSITIPESVTTIGGYCFLGCKNLLSATVLPITPPTAGSSLFAECSYNLKIYVPKKSYSAYKNASGWSSYASIIFAIQ